MLKYVALAVALAACAEAFSTGAPEDTCDDMTPKHPVAPQKSPAPYVLNTNTKVAKAGSPMEVTITGNQAANTIRGLLLQARGEDNKPIGTFTIPPNFPYAQLLNCGTPGNAVTHKKHSEPQDPQTLTFVWTPPQGYSGEIKFRSTIALNGAVFWVGVESAPVKVAN